MHVKIWGCRGSLPVSGPDFQTYGGSTSCVEVRTSDDTLIVLDAGTGIRSLGLDLQGKKAKSVHLLITHLHLDHIMGIGFFMPLWNEEINLNVWGPPSQFRSFQEQLVRYVSPPLFPIHIGDAPDSLSIHDVPDDEWQIGSATVTAAAVQHHGPTIGYRITDDGRSFTYLPDHEPARGISWDKADPTRLSGYRLAHDADVLIHDAQYSVDEYQARVGWGHSSIEDAVRFAEAVRTKQLMMFHHDPMNPDARLEELHTEAVGFSRDKLEIALTREAMEFEV